jgi:hypothetical protein
MMLKNTPMAHHCCYVVVENGVMEHPKILSFDEISCVILVVVHCLGCTFQFETH